MTNASTLFLGPPPSPSPQDEPLQSHEEPLPSPQDGIARPEGVGAETRVNNPAIVITLSEIFAILKHFRTNSRRWMGLVLRAYGNEALESEKSKRETGSEKLCKIFDKYDVPTPEGAEFPGNWLDTYNFETNPGRHIYRTAISHEISAVKEGLEKIFK